MNKTLYYYYIVCTCIRDVKFPNTEFHIGDVLYYNNNAASKEMWIFYNKNYNKTVSENDELYRIEAYENIQHYAGLCNKSYIPLTRKKKNARLYKKLSQAEWIKSIIENRNDFKCEIKNIEVAYEFEE